MTMSIELMWQHLWPSDADKPIGALDAAPDELSERFGLEFQRGLDDLDAYSQVAVRLPSGRVVQLVCYDAYRDHGTILFVDQEDDGADARREFLLSMGMDEGDLAWIQ